MAESLSFQETTTRLISHQDIINSEHLESCKSYNEWIIVILFLFEVDIELAVGS